MLLHVLLISPCLLPSTRPRIERPIAAAAAAAAATAEPPPQQGRVELSGRSRVVETGLNDGVDAFLRSPRSDVTLLHPASATPMEGGGFACELEPLSFFSLTVQPLLEMVVERSDARSLTVRIIRGRVRVGERISESVRIEGENVLRWGEESGAWQLESDISLQLSLRSPELPSLARRVWISSGNAIVSSAAGRSGRKLLREIVRVAATSASGGGS